jgi:SAM-dependent methyltransferase
MNSPTQPQVPAVAAPGEQLWEQHASWWIDGFTNGADPEYRDQIIPLALDLLANRRHVLDVGTGEGQIARELCARGATVVGLDPTAAQLRVAAQRGGGPQYLAGQADAVATRSAAFDAALACLVFEHVSDLQAGLNEVFRVLAPGGRFVWMLNHPLLQCPGSGWIIDVDLDERYWRVGPYLESQHVVEEVTKGVFIPFVHRPISTSINALLQAGFVLDQVLEPAPPSSYLEQSPELAEQASIPRLLVLSASKPT